MSTILQKIKSSQSVIQYDKCKIKLKLLLVYYNCNFIQTIFVTKQKLLLTTVFPQRQKAGNFTKVVERRNQKVYRFRDRMNLLKGFWFQIKAPGGWSACVYYIITKYVWGTWLTQFNLIQLNFSEESYRCEAGLI